tara:strand:- start:830 stop:1846 length:1017 start_codon:yes stop_codon:yes gene_type:complete
MTKDSLISLLRDFSILDTQISGDNVRFPCPYRSHTHGDLGVGEGGRVFSLSLTAPHIGRCFVCQEVSSISEMTLFLSLLNRDSRLYDLCLEKLDFEGDADAKISSAYDAMERRLTIAKKVEEDLTVVGDWFDTLPRISTEKSKFLGSRGASQMLFDLWYDSKFDPEEYRLVIPAYSPEDHKFRGAMGRALISGDEPKVRYYKGSKLGDTFLVPQTDSMFNLRVKDILLVEGVFDAFRMNYHYRELSLSRGLTSRSEVVIAAIGSNKLTSGQANILKRAYRRVHFLFDNDEAGRKGAMTSFKMIRASVPFCQILSLPDGIKDPDLVSEDDAARIIEKIR